LLRRPDLPLPGTHRAARVQYDRLLALATHAAEARDRTETLCGFGLRALQKMYLGDASFLYATEADSNAVCMLPPGHDDTATAAIVALGLGGVPHSLQRRVLRGASASTLARLAGQRARLTEDAASVALAAWAEAEVADRCDAELFARLAGLIHSGQPVATAVVAQILCAALAAAGLGDMAYLTAACTERLLAGQSSSGLFPALLASGSDSPGAGGTLPDQVFPILALARLAGATGDNAALQAAKAAAARICALQGAAGQWWWGFGLEGGTIATPYPVRSVHQHALAPLALLELADAGGPSHWHAIIRSLRWIDLHPETRAELVSERHGLVWEALTDRPGSGPAKQAPPADRVARDCRPEDFGWMLYAWRSSGATSARRKQGGTSHGWHSAGQ
jgi:hypothetical protein